MTALVLLRGLIVTAASSGGYSCGPQWHQWIAEAFTTHGRQAVLGAHCRHRVSELRTVAIEDLLGREPSTPINVLLETAVKDKTILITGAGGSIGSELCRQVLALGAHKLLLLDRSEYALYTIHQELIQLINNPVNTQASNTQAQA